MVSQQSFFLGHVSLIIGTGAELFFIIHSLTWEANFCLHFVKHILSFNV